MEETKCKNCIFWKNEEPYRKTVLFPDNCSYLISRCNWTSHPSLNQHHSYYTSEDYACNEFKPKK